MEALGIDGKLLIAQIINFVLFFYIFKRFIAKRFFSFLESAEKKEKEKERIMNELKKQEEKVQKHEKEIIADAREQASKIISDAKKAILYQKEELIKKATEEAADIKAKAAKQIDEEREILFQKAKDRLLSASALIAKSALKEFIDAPQQEALVKKIMAKTDMTRLYEN